MIEIKVNGSVVSVQETAPLYSGSADIHVCHFTFDTGWDRFSKSTVFRVGGRAVTAVVDEKDCCTLPWELLTRANIGLQIEVGVYGVSAAAEVLTTVWDSLGTVRDGSEIGNDAQEPSAGVYEQVMAGIQRVDEKVVSYNEQAQTQVQRAESAAVLSQAEAGNAARDAAAAANAAGNAQSALMGVQRALDGLPAGGTLIVNDLTTGGAAAALSAEMGKALGRRPGPNLLRGWCFAKPVNQKGQSEYTADASAWVYTVDGWKMRTAALTVGDGYCNFAAPDGTSGYKRLTQLTEHTLKAGETYTLSVLAKINSIGGTVTLRPCSGAYAALTGATGLSISAATEVPEIRAYTFTLREDVEGAGVELLIANRDGSYLDADIYAVKLEKGSVQTLASRNSGGAWVLNELPDYGEELAKCQRYYQLFSGADKRPAALADYRPAMRANPATGTIDIDGTTCYFADANL